MALSGSTIPVVLVGPGAQSGQVWIADLEAENVTRLEPGPSIQGWLGDTWAASTDRWLLITADVCSTPPAEGDAGWSCPNGDSSSTFFVLDRSSKEWKSLVLPGLFPRVSAITGDMATISTVSESSAGDQPHQLDLVDMTLAPSDPALIDCLAPGGNLIVFDEPGGANTASLVDVNTAARRTVSLPESVADSREEGWLQTCTGGSPYVVLPGALASKPVNPDLHGDDQPDVSQLDIAAAEPTTSTTGQVADPRIRVFNLQHPDRPPIALGSTEDFRGFVSGDDYWATKIGDHLHIHREADSTEATSLRIGDAIVTRSDLGPVLFEHQSPRGIASLEVIRQPGS